MHALPICKNAYMQILKKFSNISYSSYMQRWGSYFLKVTHYLLLLPITKSNSLQLHTYYPRNKVTIIILHIILLFANNFVTVSLSRILNLEVNLANEQYLAEQFLSIKLLKLIKPSSVICTKVHHYYIYSYISKHVCPSVPLITFFCACCT